MSLWIKVELTERDENGAAVGPTNVAGPEQVRDDLMTAGPSPINDRNQDDFTETAARLATNVYLTWHEREEARRDSKQR